MLKTYTTGGTVPDFDFDFPALPTPTSVIDACAVMINRERYMIKCVNNVPSNIVKGSLASATGQTLTTKTAVETVKGK